MPLEVEWRSRRLPNSIERGRNCARGFSESRPLSRSLPRLLLFPDHRATPTADVAVNLLVEQHQKKTLSNGHGASAGRAEQLARLQVFKVLLLLRRNHQNREPSGLSCLSDQHFAEVLAQQQLQNRPRPHPRRVRRPLLPCGCGRFHGPSPSNRPQTGPQNGGTCFLRVPGSSRQAGACDGSPGAASHAALRHGSSSVFDKGGLAFCDGVQFHRPAHSGNWRKHTREQVDAVCSEYTFVTTNGRRRAQRSKLSFQYL